MHNELEGERESGEDNANNGSTCRQRELSHTKHRLTKPDFCVCTVQTQQKVAVVQCSAASGSAVCVCVCVGQPKEVYALVVI